MSQDTKVTVCIPTYNSCATLPKVLKTLMQQEFRDFEILICDDGSSDGTWELLEGLQIPNLRIFRNIVNINLPRTMKRLFDSATGDYIAMHHDHEYVKPNWMSNMVRIFERYPKVGMVVPAYDAIRSNGEYILRHSTEEDKIFSSENPLAGEKLIKILAVKVGTPISAHGTMFRSYYVQKAGGYSNAWGLASDEDLYRRVAKISDVAFCHETVVTCVDRPIDRHFSLGSFSGCYTIYEFRKDTTMRYWQATAIVRQWNLFRLSILKGLALVRETLYRWMFGTTEDLDWAIAWDKVPPLPSGSPLLRRGGKLSMTILVAALKKLPRLGQFLGLWRRRLQG